MNWCNINLAVTCLDQVPLGSCTKFLDSASMVHRVIYASNGPTLDDITILDTGKKAWDY